MLESLNASNEMQYQKLSAEEQASRGILGRLVGIIADFKKPTRNGRKYTESLWDKTFENPIMKEKLANRCLFGELGHPEDRQEVDMEKIAICMAEPPKKGNDGKLHGVFDILSTPNGRILKTLCDYGCSIGVSSRGSGDTYTDYDGEEVVDEDTFECECWDAVLIPAVKEARMQLVTESLNTSKKSLKKALQESLEQANENDKKTMMDTLDKLEIEYKDDSEKEISEEAKKDEVADNIRTDLIHSLQETLSENQELNNKVLELQEQLSVSYTKEVKNEERINTLKQTITRLKEEASRFRALENQLSTMKAQLQESLKTVEKNKKVIESYRTKIRNVNDSRNSLSESLSSKDLTIAKLSKEVKTLTESTQLNEKANQRKIEKLTSELVELKQDSEAKNSQYNAKLQKSNKLIESYKKIASKAIDKYIESKAINLGITTDEIKNKLKENYSFDDIDNICEDLRSYKLNMSRLPFSVNTEKISKVTLKEDTSLSRFKNPDDVVDEALFNLINN